MKNRLKKYPAIQSFISMWLPVFLWAGIIFYFSSQPQKHASDFFLTDFIVKKSSHIGEYAILYWLTFRATGRKFVKTYILVMLYAAFDEIHQGFVPGRSPKLYDVLGFDLTGANIASFALWKLQQALPNKHKN